LLLIVLQGANSGGYGGGGDRSSPQLNGQWGGVDFRLQERAAWRNPNGGFVLCVLRFVLFVLVYAWCLVFGAFDADLNVVSRMAAHEKHEGGQWLFAVFQSLQTTPSPSCSGLLYTTCAPASIHVNGL
jgi:hypothetical protein